MKRFKLAQASCLLVCCFLLLEDHETIHFANPESMYTRTSVYMRSSLKNRAAVHPRNFTPSASRGPSLMPWRFHRANTSRRREGQVGAFLEDHGGAMRNGMRTPLRMSRDIVAAPTPPLEVVVPEALLVLLWRSVDVPPCLPDELRDLVGEVLVVVLEGPVAQHIPEDLVRLATTAVA